MSNLKFIILDTETNNIESFNYYFIYHLLCLGAEHMTEKTTRDIERSRAEIKRINEKFGLKIGVY